MEIDSRIYVAGHKGMVGSAIVRKLESLGYKNIIKKDHTALDLTDFAAVDAFFAEYKPEYVLVAAAKVGGIKANSTYPADFLIENLLIQNNIILSAQKYSAKKLLFLASACIYPKDSEQPIMEKSLLSGRPEVTNEAYAIAKITGLKMCEYLNTQYGLDFITAMPANAYGINDCFDENNSHVIPALIKRFHEAKVNNKDSVVLWGTGKAKREFLYVDDLADATVFLMNNYSSSQFINIGSGEEVSMSELADVIKDVVGYYGDIVYDVSKPDGMMRRVVDSSAINELGWVAKTKLKEGIFKEYEYYLSSIRQ